MMCYGSGTTSISVVSPLNNSIVNGIVPIVDDIQDFAVRKDGGKCMYIDGKLQFCLLQPQLSFALNITGSLTRDVNVTVVLSLTSNVYTDTLRWSTPVVLQVAQQSQLHTASMGTDVVPAGCIVHSIDFERLEQIQAQQQAQAQAPGSEGVSESEEV